MTWRNNWYGYNPQKDESDESQQQQLLKQKQESLHKMKLALETFHNTLEPLEEYIDKARCFPKFGRQLYRRTIQDSDGSLEEFEDLFLSQLFIFKSQIRKKPEDFRKELKKEYYRWIDATGIDIDNCPERLKHFLFEINEVLEGRGDSIVNQTRELIKDQELNPQEAVGLFGDLQNPLNRNRDLKQGRKGKKWNEAGNEGRIEGDFDQGQEVFNQISQSVSSHDNFDLFSEQKKRRGIQSNDFQHQFEIVQNVKNNPQNWRIDEVITEYNNLGQATKKEEALINNSVEVGYDGAVSNWQQQIYLAKKFTPEEQAEIKQALGISQSSDTTQVNRNLIEEIKRNANEFEFQLVLTFNGHRYDAINKGWVEYGKEKKETILVHKSVQISDDNYNEFGYLPIQQDKMFQEHRFNREEWIEIKNALENNKIIERVNQDDWIIATVNSTHSGSYEALINKSAIEGRNLKDSGEVYKKSQFTDEEWAKIERNRNSNQQHSKSQVFSLTSKSQPNQSNSGNTSLIITLVAISVLLVGGIVIVRKKLSKKID